MAKSREIEVSNPMVVRGIDRVLTVQRPAVLAHIRSIRRKNPDATPQQLVRILELRYLAAVTTGGAAVGATAVIPAIGTGVTLALSGVETAGFLEATALFAQSVAEVHGIAVEDPDRARSRSASTTTAAESGSRFPVGSSARRIAGSSRSARHSAIRCAWPPET